VAKLERSNSQVLYYTIFGNNSTATDSQIARTDMDVAEAGARDEREARKTGKPVSP
jgi:hypothetical protein